MIVVPFIFVHVYFAIAYGCATNFIPSVMNYAATYFKFIGSEFERFDEDYKTLEREEVEVRLNEIIKSYQRILQ